MLCGICIHRPIVENDLGAYEANLTFHDEQPLQEGKRLFEEVLLHLARQEKLDCEIMNWNEFWGAFDELCKNEAMSEILSALIPGTFRIRWALPPYEEKIAALGRRPTVIQIKREEEMNQAEKPRPISASGQAPSPAGEGGIKSTPMTAWAAPGASRPQSPSSSPRASGKIAAKAGRMPSSPS